MELVDQLAADGSVLRTVTRAEMRARRLRHRCVFVIVVDSSGRTLVQKRSATKDLWPSRWDIGAGGVVVSGEESSDAARRELAEELGIEGCEPTFVRTALYDDDDVSEVADMYQVVWDGAVAFADGEVIEARWLTWTELAQLLAVEPFVPDAIALMLPHLVPPGFVKGRLADGAGVAEGG